MHKSRLGTLVVDCKTDDLGREAEFWSAALGLRAESGDNPVNPKYIRLQGDPSAPLVLLQQVDHDSRVHIDIETDDIPREVERLRCIGARIVQELPRWTVMEAPSGHRFCIISPVRDGFDQHATSWK